MPTYLRCLTCGQAWQPPETQPIAPCPSCASTDVRRFPVAPVAPFAPPARSSSQEQSVGLLLFVACGVLALVLLPILLFAVYLGLTHILR